MSVAKVEPTRAELEVLFAYVDTCFDDGQRSYRGGFLWREHTWAKRRVVRDRVATHGVAFAGGYYRHPKSGLEYPVIGTPYGKFLTHRLVWVWHHGPVPSGMMVDHRDRDTFHNRITNLRLSSDDQNRRNRGSYRGSTSKYVGVHFRADTQKWRAGIKLNGKPVHLGSFESEVDAALARDAAAKKHYGGFAHLNFPLVRA